MSTLIFPMGGQSSRFPNVKPKWMLTHPKSNTYMVLETLKGINHDFFDKIIFTFLQDHENKYKFFESFKLELQRLNILHKTDFLFLQKSTNNQPETVYETIRQKEISGFILIKDCDSYYETVITHQNNQVCFHDLNEAKETNAISKSYIEFDNDRQITNIVEKKIISSFFNVGGYGFQDAQIFARYYELLNNQDNNFYVSNIIHQMLIDKNIFIAQKTYNFKDWGTLQDWRKFTDKFQTLFLDLDGTLVTNTSHLMEPRIGDSKPLENNIKTIQELYEQGNIHIIITTSRPEAYKNETIKELERFNIPYDQLIMGLPHAKRIVINDFANSNPYPSCEAINIPRNYDDLKSYIK
jgi:hypothetical protein